jgi:hypothetical protein
MHNYLKKWQELYYATDQCKYELGFAAFMDKIVFFLLFEKFENETIKDNHNWRHYR